jgi:hypothetical protein
LKNEFFDQDHSQRKKEIKKKWKGKKMFFFFKKKNSLLKTYSFCLLELQKKQYDNVTNSSKTTNGTPEMLSTTIKGSVVNTSGKTIKLKPLPDDGTLVYALFLIFLSIHFIECSVSFLNGY